MSGPFEGGKVLEVRSTTSGSRDEKDWKNEKSFDHDIEVREIGGVASVVDIHVMDDEEKAVFGEDRGRLSNTLKQRHIQMIALVSTIGTGIFLSSGGVLATAGPLGCFLSFLIIGVVVGLNQICIAECAALLPATSAVLRHSEQFVDPAWGFAYGWVNVWSAILPGEVSAAAVIVSYWSDLSPAIWITIIIVLIIFFNFLKIRYYGEIEFGFAMIKIVLLIGLIIVSIVITCGGGPNGKTIGFQYWRNPGPFVEYDYAGNKGKFVGFWKALMSTVYSYGGVQSVPNLAAEVQYPRKTTFTACKRVFYRVTFLMCTAAFCIGLIVPSNNSTIASSTGNAASSPFVVAIKNANIKVLPHIVNGAVLTSAFSVANQGVIGGSRVLFSLAVKNQAPKIFLKSNRWGVPYVATTFICAFLPLAYMSCSDSASTVFSWFQAIASSSNLLQWITISVSHISLARAMKAQGIPRSRLPHNIRFAPQAAWISGGLSTLFLLTGGFLNFAHGHFVLSSFFSAYFIIPLFGVLFFGWKFIKGTRWWRPEEVELEVLFKDSEDHPEPADKPLKGWRVLTLLWS